MRVKAAATQVGLWGCLALGVTLFTVLFSILGVITTSVVTGVVLGAARRWKWQAIPVSLFFPLAGLTLAQAAKADLTVGQRLSMAGLCWGAFWGIYFLTLLLTCAEKRDAAVADREASRAAAPQGRGESVPAEAGSRLGYPDPATATEAAEPAGQLSLGDLQGTWLCETCAEDAPGPKRKMEIVGGRFAFNVVSANGGSRLVARGNIRLKGRASARMLVVSAPRSPEPNTESHLAT